MKGTSCSSLVIERECCSPDGRVESRIHAWSTVMSRDRDSSESGFGDGDAVFSRRHFNSTVAAGAAYTVLNPLGAAGISAQASRQEELCEMNAVDLAVRLARREVSARDVMSAHLARIERVNPQINAIVTLVPEQAMAGAAKADDAIV